MHYNLYCIVNMYLYNQLSQIYLKFGNRQSVIQFIILHLISKSYEVYPNGFSSGGGISFVQ